MATVNVKAVIFLSVLVISLAEKNLQEWSIYTKMDAPVTFRCNDSVNQINVSFVESRVWRKKDHHGVIESGDLYTLRDGNETLNFTVTDETSGIYFCEMKDMNDMLVGIIVKGVNVEVREYDDFLDEYKRNLIVGSIAAGSVLFLVVSLGLLSNFRYKSEEQLEKRRQRKLERLQRQQGATAYNGHDNRGITLDEMPSKNENFIIYTGSDQYSNGKTHL